MNKRQIPVIFQIFLLIIKDNKRQIIKRQNAIPEVIYVNL